MLSLIVIMLTVVVAFAVGMYFLTVKTPSSPSISTTTFSTTGSVTSTSTTTVTSVHTVTTSYSSTTSTVHSFPSDVLVSGNIFTSGTGTQADTISFRETNGSVFYASVDSSGYAITLPNNANFAVVISWTGAYSWQQGFASYNFSTFSISPNLEKNWSLTTYDSMIALTGNLSTSGSGTRITEIMFSSSHGQNYTSTVSKGNYGVNLPNYDSYTVYAMWSGNYSWQSGSVILGILDTNASSTMKQDWNVSTPASQILVSGDLSTTGTGTSVSALRFQGNHGASYYVGVSNSKYSIGLPNDQTYNVSVSWRGSYAFQSGNIESSLVLSEGPSVTSLQADYLNLQTPNSLITVSGSVSTTGSGTSATAVTFSSPIAGSYSIQVTGSGHYSISLPNLANYSAIVAWAGQYSWQSGSENVGQFELDIPISSGMTYNWLNVETPNSNILGSGSITTSGTGTSMVSVEFTSSHGNYSAVLSGSLYSATIPNIANYSVIVKYAGQYSWQNGTTNFPLMVNGGAGVSTFTANWSIPTPNSMITISGTLSYASGKVPYNVEFVSQNSGTTFTAAASSGSFSVSLPNDMNYSIVVYYSSNGQILSENLGAFDLYATPGVSVITVSWSI